MLEQELMVFEFYGGKDPESLLGGLTHEELLRQRSASKERKSRQRKVEYRPNKKRYTNNRNGTKPVMPEHKEILYQFEADTEPDLSALSSNDKLAYIDIDNNTRTELFRKYGPKGFKNIAHTGYEIATESRNLSGAQRFVLSMLDLVDRDGEGIALDLASKMGLSLNEVWGKFRYEKFGGTIALFPKEVFGLDTTIVTDLENSICSGKVGDISRKFNLQVEYIKPGVVVFDYAQH
jgi:hypothetical protein